LFPFRFSFVGLALITVESLPASAPRDGGGGGFRGRGFQSGLNRGFVVPGFNRGFVGPLRLQSCIRQSPFLTFGASRICGALLRRAGTLVLAPPPPPWRGGGSPLVKGTTACGGRVISVLSGGPGTWHSRCCYRTDPVAWLDGQAAGARVHPEAQRRWGSGITS
jgi:hypothetical protein